MNRFWFRMASLGLMLGLNYLLDKYDTKLEALELERDELEEQCDDFQTEISEAADELRDMMSQLEHVRQWDNDIDLSASADDVDAPDLGVFKIANNFYAPVGHSVDLGEMKIVELSGAENPQSVEL